VAAAAWETCTKAAVSYQLSAVSKIRGPARESGAFCCRNPSSSTQLLAISFAWLKLGSPSMKWITANQLEDWADKSVLSRTDLSELVSSLVRASATRPNSFHFPTGDSAQMHGYDGSLESEGAPPFVPEGSSVWEFSTEDGPAGKAERDYQARIKDPRGRVPAETSFVFVTPRKWEDRDRWALEKKKEKLWKDVRVIHSVDLEEWLERNTAVAARMAWKLLGLMPSTGVRSTDEFWDEYASRFAPPLTEQVLLAGRATQASSLLQQLQGVPQPYQWQADSLDEGVAFAVAAIRLAEDKERKYVEARTLVLETKEAALQLANRTDLIFLVRAGALELAGLLGRRSPTLVPVGRDQLGKGVEILRRPHFGDLGDALKTMGFPEERAHQLARECGRSVTILSRRIGSPGSKAPIWRKDRSLLPALLAGAWSAYSEDDLKAVHALTDEQSYAAYEKALLPYIGLSEDHPLEREGEVWTLRAPVDAFVLLGFLIAGDDLRKFGEVVTTVFSELDPALELPAEERFYAGVTGKKLKHSDWLRRGLATTLLLIAEFHEEAGLHAPGMTPQDFVNDLIAKLPGLHSDYRVVASLYGVLPAIAEAAPRPLLQALGQLIEGDGQKILPIFQDKEADLFHSSSPHTALLWALETLAWDPTYLSEASLTLARLARLDPGGKLANRPIRSLREIFLIWHPGTNATMEQRLAAIDQITRLEPAVGWELLISLLPKYHDVASPTSKPRYREAGASQAEPITYASIGKGYKQIVDRILALAGDDPTRWVSVIHHIRDLSPQDRGRAVELLEASGQRMQGRARTELWSVLRAEVNRNRRFPTADWVMQDADLRRLEEIVAALAPQDPLVQVAWLFNDYNPDLPDVDLLDQWQAVQSRRTEVVLQLYGKLGAASVLDLASAVKLPAQVGFAFANGAELDWIESLVGESLKRVPNPDLFAIALSAGADFRFKSAWRPRISHLYEIGQWTAVQTGWLTLEFSDDYETWAFVESLGAEVERVYWTQKAVRPIKADETALEVMAAKYLSHGRALAALNSVWYSGGSASSETLLRILDESIVEINAAPDTASTNLAWEVEQLFGILRARENVPPIEIARREYAYLPLLHFSQVPLTIHSLLMQDPDFFVELLCDVFKPASGEAREPTEERRARAAAGFRVLSECRTIPGLKDGNNIDNAELTHWVARVRELAAVRDRSAIADEYVGHILAHAPFDRDDGAWPHRAVRDLIENLALPGLERGIRIERFNMRGPTTRGPFDGGNQERALAATIRDWSKSTVQWPRTTKLLSDMANEWERHAEEEDVRARQDEMRFS
jgi:hypothetical protein